MRKPLPPNSVVALALLTLLAVTGCKRSKRRRPSPKPARPGRTASAERTSFAQVTSQARPGRQPLSCTSAPSNASPACPARLGAWRGLLGAIPDLKAEDRENLDKAFDIVTNLIQKSGIEDVSGFGMSAIARETNFYHSKLVLHHYPGKGSGFLWNMFGQKPHALDGLNLLPASTALAAFTDLDAPMLWSVDPKAGRPIRLPASRRAAQQAARELREATGLKWDQRPRLARRRVRLRRHAR